MICMKMDDDNKSTQIVLSAYVDKDTNDFVLKHKGGRYLLTINCKTGKIYRSTTANSKELVEAGFVFDELGRIALDE